MKIDGCIFLTDPYGGKPFFESHQMEIVDVAPHLASIATFCVYRRFAGWKITNLETGQCVGSETFSHRRDALINAQKYLSLISETMMERRYEKFPREFK